MSDNNVYFARGHGVDQFPGNRRYRELVGEFAEEYKSTESKTRKTEIAENIITTLRSSMGSQFVRQPKNGAGFEWEVLEDSKEVMKKVRQSLRDSNATSTATTIIANDFDGDDAHPDDHGDYEEEDDDMMSVDPNDEQHDYQYPPPPSLLTVTTSSAVVSNSFAFAPTEEQHQSQFSETFLPPLTHCSSTTATNTPAATPEGQNYEMSHYFSSPNPAVQMLAPNQKQESNRSMTHDEIMNSSLGSFVVDSQLNQMHSRSIRRGSFFERCKSWTSQKFMRL
jgi:hypothetical protein